ncbi:MAG TPA: nucleotidyltransferase family protein [Chthoniobacterales bacterium]|nr:nucleotidyltransferase family protein [Chthoniobacterales bacterium]
MRKVGAIILAAGGSGRFGRPKQLLAFRGESLVRRAARCAAEACGPRVVVVAGDTRTLIEAELRESAAIVAENPDWRSGLGTSIRCGLQRLIASTTELDAVVLLACDQPFVEAQILAALVAEQERSGKPIVASSYANTLGIPALFDRSCFKALLALPDDSGAKALIESRPDDVASIEFEKGAIDIDTPADFERLTSAKFD